MLRLSRAPGLAVGRMRSVRPELQLAKERRSYQNPIKDATGNFTGSKSRHIYKNLAMVRKVSVVYLV